MPSVRITVSDALTEDERDQLVRVIAFLYEQAYTGGGSAKPPYKLSLWESMHAKLAVSTAITIVREIP